MRIEEAIVYLLATESCGMTAETLAEQINLRRLHRRRDGQPVGTNQIWAVVFRNGLIPNPHVVKTSEAFL